jgi:hypothetical protein
MGPASKEIKDNPVKAAEVSNTLPVDFAIKTKTTNVTNGAIAVVLFAKKKVSRVLR